MEIRSPERGQWMLTRNGRDLFEGVDTPRGSGLYGCKMCALAGDTVRLPHHQHEQHFADHMAAKTTSKEEGTMSTDSARPEGDLQTQLKRITKRIASTQFTIQHPEKYTKAGTWTPEQLANLETKLANEKAIREQIRAERGTDETKKQSSESDENKKVAAPVAKPDPKKKPTRAAAKKTTAAAKKKTTAKKTTTRKASTKKTTSTRSRAAARKR